MILKSIRNTSGFSIVATVMVMMLLALFAAVAVSLVTTGSNVAVQEERGLEAFYIADGGLQYAIKANNFPDYDVASKLLGDGSFIVTGASCKSPENAIIVMLNLFQHLMKSMSYETLK